MISIVHLFLFLQYSCLEKKLRQNTALCKIKKSAFAMLSLVTGSCGMCYRILSFKCSDEILFWIIIHQRLLDTDVKRDALELAKAGQWDDAGPEQAIAQGGAGGGTLANSQVSFYKL